MCLGAIYWAHIRCIYYGNNRIDAADIDFDDNFIYEEIEKPINRRTVPFIPLLREETIESFRKWEAKTDKTRY